MPWFSRFRFWRASRASDSRASLLSLQEDIVKSSFHEKRGRALRNPTSVEKTTEAYATLMLQLTGLPQHWNPKKIYIELYKNDLMEDSSFATFNERKEIEIYSPLSIVRVSVKHAGNPGGFVEIFVADLEPVLDCSEVNVKQGRFRLCHAADLLGRADHRFEKARKSEASRTFNPPSPLRGCAHRREPVQDAYVYMKLALKVHGKLSDEWFAFCLPSPTFVNFKPSTGQLKVNELYKNIMDFLNLFWEESLQPLVTTCQYVIFWRSIWLSSVILAWWTITSIWTWMWVPSLPLFLAMWIGLLRDPQWRKEILAHEKTASLDEAGFALVAAFYETGRMATWIERVIQEEMTPPGEVIDNGKLFVFASTVWAPRKGYRRAKKKLTFGDLLSTLQDKDWIKKQPQRATTDKEAWWPKWVPASYLPFRLRTTLMSYSDMLEDNVTRLTELHSEIAKRLPLYTYDCSLGCQRFPGISQIKLELCCIALSLVLFFLWHWLELHPVKRAETSFFWGIAFIHGDLAQIRGMRLIFGTGVMLYLFPPVQFILRYFRANRRRSEALRRRQKGGINEWAFFQE